MRYDDCPVKLYRSSSQDEKDWYEFLIKEALTFIFPVGLAKDCSQFFRYTNSFIFAGDLNLDKVLCVGSAATNKFTNLDVNSIILLKFNDYSVNSKDRSTAYNFVNSVVNKINFSITDFVDNLTEFPFYSVFSNGKLVSYKEKLVSHTNHLSFKERYKIHKNLCVTKPIFSFKDKFSYVIYDTQTTNNHSYAELIYADEDVASIKSGWQRHPDFKTSLKYALYNHYENTINDYDKFVSDVLSKYNTKELDTILIKFLVELLNN